MLGSKKVQEGINELIDNEISISITLFNSIEDEKAMKVLHERVEYLEELKRSFNDGWWVPRAPTKYWLGEMNEE